MNEGDDEAESARVVSGICQGREGLEDAGGRRWRRLLLILTLVAVGVAGVVVVHPLNSMVMRLALVGCVVGAWVGMVVLGWRGRWGRVGLLVLPVLAVVPVMLPEGEIDAEELRADYVRRLGVFEGTRYYWGGESARGIDCSGLPRRAMRDALLAYGVRHGNGRAIREWVGQWWFDASARALAAGYRGYTVPVGMGGTIREMDYGALRPGDLAVTASGVHILAYAGGGRWIQADPGLGRVVTLDGRVGENGWFLSAVTVHRWRVLVEGATR